MVLANQSRSLRIAQVAPLWTSCPPATYGGTELMVHLLTDELTRRGHEVTLFATGDSQTRANLRAVYDSSVADAMVRGYAYAYEHYANAGLVDALREAETFDLIHCHLGCPQIPIGILGRSPVLHTLHAPLSPDDLWILKRYPEVPIAGISGNQVEVLLASRRSNLRVIHHGIDVGAYDCSVKPGKYLAFLGRMGPQKSPLHAIQIAKKVGIPIILAGKPQNSQEERYFAERIQPLIDGAYVKYIGQVNHAQKNELLKHASALLFPIQGDEAFGLVMIEAMACGTPVVASNRSSVSELLDVGQTGFYADSIDEMASCVARACLLDRTEIREQAERRFSHLRMTDDYLDWYASMLAASVR